MTILLTMQRTGREYATVAADVTVTAAINHEEALMQTLEEQTDVKLSWADTAKAMAAAAESWSDSDVATSDGLADLAWASSCVAEKKSGYGE
jgi:hypothetical protein